MLNDRNEKCRTGLRVVTRKNVHNDVRRAARKFAAWLRLHYDFPIRVTVYLYSVDCLKSSSDEDVVSIFFQPLKRNKEPGIYLATGDYKELIKKLGNRDNALCSIIVDQIALHILNYQNWWFNHNWSKATCKKRRNLLIRNYATDIKYII